MKSSPLKRTVRAAFAMLTLSVQLFASRKSLVVAIFALFAIVGLLTPLSARAAKITVTSTSDSGPGSLRDAIASASPGDTINFSLAPYPATITLTSGTLTVNKSLTISGPGASNLAISGNNSVQVFSVGSVTATISGVTIQNGNSYQGGGIANNGGTLTVTNSMVSGNFATAYGGGIFSYEGTLTITNSTFSGNIASPNSGGDGGGLWNWGTLTIINSTFSGNSAYFGGGMENYLGPGAIVFSTFSGNSAASGGGIFSNITGTLALKNTIVANSPSGGNCIDDGTTTSYGHNLLDDGSCSGFLTQVGDIINTPAGLDPAGLKSNGGPTQTIALLSTSPAVNAIPQSPVNYCTAVDGTTPIVNDQRGISRPQDWACDIGAFELQADTDQGLAVLNASNTFNGNQTVNGSVTANSFAGNGAGLTGVNAATATTASGLNCAGCVSNTQLAINYAGSSSQGGPASNALLFGGLAPGAFATIGTNIFTGLQEMPSLVVTGAGLAPGNTSIVPGGLGITGGGIIAPSSSMSATGLTIGKQGVSGISAFQVDAAGDVAAAGSVTIGGGTPIVEYVSTTESLTIPALTPGSCQTFTTAAVSGLTPGASDTVALGVPASLLSNLGNGIFLVYQAWETTTTASPTITIQVCNPTAVKYKGGATGTIRIDVSKH